MSRIDPDLAEAMDRARAPAAALRMARMKLDALGSQPDLRPLGALKSQISDLSADIRLIAERAGVDRDVLLWILSVEHDLRRRYNGRKPPADMLARTLGRAVGEAERKLHDAHMAATAAQLALQRANRDAYAAGAAVRIVKAAA